MRFVLDFADRGRPTPLLDLRKTDRPRLDNIPLVYTDSDEETDEMKKKISFMELEEILKGKSLFMKKIQINK